MLYPLGDDAGLGPLEPWHAEEFADSVARSREHLAPWIPFAHTVTDAESARAFLQRFADAHAADTRHLFGIWRDGRIVGGVMFPTFEARTGNCEIGVWLAPEAQGRGLITRAVRSLIDWAFRTRGMSRVEWNTDPRNARSRAVAQRFGMTFEGVRRSRHPVAGERQDSETWSLLADEWNPPPSDDLRVAYDDVAYATFGTDVAAAVRRDAFGTDIGQHGWLTEEEWRRCLRWAKLTGECRLLDVGSGSGGPAVAAAAETGCHVVGIDRHESAVATAQRLADERGVADRTRFVAADASLRLPFADGSFDAITCIDAIHHLGDRAAVLAEWRRVLRPGGHMIFTDPAVVTGPLSDAEIAAGARTAPATFTPVTLTPVTLTPVTLTPVTLTPVDLNERLLHDVGLDLVRCDDTTETVATLAARLVAARSQRRAELTSVEGQAAFEARQRSLDLAATLAGQRRLSRFLLHAVG
jgi:RimJ/RimL family protein N-acetyltransferase/2-polyprenyl-3-methyl-5-hydroxy-6-metoxy-1,4-benzoquinol methylase